MSPRRLPADAGPAPSRPPLPILRLALPADGEERRRASLYRGFLRRGASLPATGAAAMPPLQRGRMVPARIEVLTLRRLMEKVRRQPPRSAPALPEPSPGKR